jgi:hypothetical protein
MGNSEVDSRTQSPIQFSGVLLKSEVDGIITAVVYAPYLVDGDGMWSDPSVIQLAAHDYAQGDRALFLNHTTPLTRDQAVLVESWVSDQPVKYGSVNLDAGAWLVRLRLRDKQLLPFTVEW